VWTRSYLEAEPCLQLNGAASQRAAGAARAASDSEIPVWSNYARGSDGTKIGVYVLNVGVRLVEQVVEVGADFEPGIFT
jgi:hypothetical protein